MPIIDLHCDTLHRLDELNDGSGLKRNNLSIDIEKMKAADVAAQFFAMYVDLKKHDNPLNQALKLFDLFSLQLETNLDEIELAHSWQEAKTIRENGKIACFLTIEEGGVLGGSLDNLGKLYSLGVRLITLTWNYPNEIGYPHNYPAGNPRGLTPFGCELVEVMNEKGLLIDTSHLSDEGFYDVAKLSKKPFIASHSNARTVTCRTRNLTDDMIKKLADSGGVMGINFANIFLGSSPISRVEDMVTHIKHIYHAGGIEVIALGSDFDGIEPALEIENMGQIYKLTDALEQAGFKGDALEKICWRNAARVMEEVLV